MTHPRLLVIFMHGAGRYYLAPLLSAGRLPCLDRIRRGGHQRYFQTEFPIAAGAWVTLLTGQSTATHGVIDYIDRDSRAYDGMAGHAASSADYRDRTVLSILSKAGRRVASVYLPMTNPPWPVNGVMIQRLSSRRRTTASDLSTGAGPHAATVQRASPADVAVPRLGTRERLPHSTTCSASKP